ncbi:hypothetical protein D9M71_419110 [compost metagenome]
MAFCVRRISKWKAWSTCSAPSSIPANASAPNRHSRTARNASIWHWIQRNLAPGTGTSPAACSTVRHAPRSSTAWRPFPSTNHSMPFSKACRKKNAAACARPIAACARGRPAITRSPTACNLKMAIHAISKAAPACTGTSKATLCAWPAHCSTSPTRSSGNNG